MWAIASKVLLTIITLGLNLLFGYFKNYRRYNMSHHPFFGRMKYYLRVIVPNIPVENPYKKDLIVLFLTIKFKIFYEAYDKICRNIDKIPMTDIDNRIEWLTKHIETYENEARKQGVPEILISKFSEWNQVHVEGAVECIENIWQGKYHQRKYDKLAAELDVIQCTFTQTILAAEKTMNSLNGELDEWLKEHHK